MQQKIKSLIELNKKHSELFCEQRLRRDLYLAKHPTKVVAFKCMDGRIHLPNITNTPLGIIQPFRNIGGKFDLGWPLLNITFDDVVMESVSKGNRVLVLVTYHYSQGDKHRGCAGFDYDTECSKEFVTGFKKQIERVYGINNKIVVPIVIGIETDKDAIILHGDNGEVVDLTTVTQTDDESLLTMIRRLYPNMPERICKDLLPIVHGNIEHIAEAKGKKPETELVHGEWVLAVGKGFDWLHKPNLALIVGPYDPNIGQPIKTAAGIIKSNLENGRIKNGFVVLASSSYTDADDIVRAKERSLFMCRLTKQIIKEEFAEIAKFMHPMAVVVNYNTMQMEIVEA